jgi:hypothetical protein
MAKENPLNSRTPRSCHTEPHAQNAVVHNLVAGFLRSRQQLAKNSPCISIYSERYVHLGPYRYKVRVPIEGTKEKIQKINAVWSFSLIPTKEIYGSPFSKPYVEAGLSYKVTSTKTVFPYFVRTTFSCHGPSI